MKTTLFWCSKVAKAGIKYKQRISAFKILMSDYALNMCNTSALQKCKIVNTSKQERLSPPL